jgi:hypothetical protein
MVRDFDEKTNGTITHNIPFCLRTGQIDIYSTRLVGVGMD